MTPEKNPLLEKAVTLLSYRAHSRKELSDKLKHKTGCKDAELAEVLDRLEELGFLNDRTYASSVVRSCATDPRKASESCKPRRGTEGLCVYGTPRILLG